MADAVNTKYKNLLCYQGMDTQDQKTFDKLADEYGRMLNEGVHRTLTIYTAHDFDHHCFDLYRIISLYLLKEKGIKELTTEELYLLNLSVLLHDMSMCKGGYENGTCIPFDREIHSLQSAQWIRYEYESEGRPLNKCGLTSSQIEIICSICQAHSDLKDRAVPSGLFASDLEYKKNGDIGVVRVKALAGILRIADELDVTSHRLRNPNEIDALITKLPDDKCERPEVEAIIQRDQESVKHFQRLLLIIDLEETKDISEIALRLDSSRVQRRLDAADEMNLVDDLLSVMNKIQKELDDLWHEVLSQSEANAAHLITLRKVVWSDKDAKLAERLFPPDEPDPPVDILPIPIRDAQETSASDNAQDDAGNPLVSTIDGTDIAAAGTTAPAEADYEGQTVRLLSQDLSQRLYQQVMSDHLLSVGHYQLNAAFCARDWINTTDILNSSPLADDIINAFSSHILESFGAMDITIVGLDLMGAITAAQIGFALRLPFTYVIPARQYSNVDAHEVRVPGIPEEHRIVLVTDGIVTGLTISKIIEDNHWEERILAIYTVFYRKPRALSIDSTVRFPCTVNAINWDFPAEIALVSNCPYGDAGKHCQALNKKL